MNTTKLCRWTAVAALAIAAAGTASAASASEEGGELVLWGWASSDAEDAALTTLLDTYSASSGVTITFEPQTDIDTALQAALAVGGWWYSRVSSNSTPAVASVTASRIAPDASTISVPSTRSELDATPCSWATCSSIRSRTAMQAACTAPPLIQVWRDADDEPADPTPVSIRSSTTSSTPSTSRRSGERA